MSSRQEPSVETDGLRPPAELADEFAAHRADVESWSTQPEKTSHLVRLLSECEGALDRYGFVSRETVFELVGIVGEMTDAVRRATDANGETLSGEGAQIPTATLDPTTRDEVLDLLSMVLLTASEVRTTPTVSLEAPAHASPGNTHRKLQRTKRTLEEQVGDEPDSFYLHKLLEDLDTLCRRLDDNRLDDEAVQAVHASAAQSVKLLSDDDDCRETLGVLLGQIRPLQHPEFRAY